MVLLIMIEKLGSVCFGGKDLYLAYSLLSLVVKYPGNPL